jgi:hypothetical protein
VYLYRLGRFAFRNRWLMLGVWLLLLLAAGVAAQTLAGQTTSSFSIPGTPAQEAADLMAERAPQMSEGGTRARFVFAAPEGERIDQPEYEAAIQATLGELRAWPSNISVVLPDYDGEPLADNQRPAEVRDPFVTQSISPNGRVAIAEVLFQVQSFDLVAETREFLTLAGDDSRDAGLQVEVGGDALQAPVEQGLTELIGVAVAAVVLTITFGSLVAAGLPLLMAILGIGIGISLITAATGFVDMSAESSILAMMLGLAVAIDYSLFIVSRHRVELAKGKVAGRVDRDGRRDGRQRRRIRRHHGDHRACRAVGRRDSVPDDHGIRGGGDGVLRHPHRDLPASRCAGLRRTPRPQPQGAQKRAGCHSGGVGPHIGAMGAVCHRQPSAGAPGRNRGAWSRVGPGISDGPRHSRRRGRAGGFHQPQSL